MKVVCIIPSRMNSSRFPGKPLEKILGIPMIGHCYQKAKIAFGKKNVFVATCDQEIVDYINLIDGNVIMTSKKHKRATTRTSEAARIIKDRLKMQFDIIVMYQGDEPLIIPSDLSKILNSFRDKKVKVANLMSKIDNKKILYDKNNVKVVVKKNLDALYFSRETIPYIENLNENYIFYLQSGIIAFRASALLDFNKIKETYLEKAESVDMNRLLENNINIRMVLSKGLTLGIDTKKEMIFAAKILRNDTYIKKYI